MRKTIPTVALLVAAAVLIPCRAAAETAPAEVGDGTKVTVTANLSGQIEPGWDEAVDRTWRHFLTDRLLPYVKSGFIPLN